MVVTRTAIDPRWASSGRGVYRGIAGGAAGYGGEELVGLPGRPGRLRGAALRARKGMVSRPAQHNAIACRGVHWARPRLRHGDLDHAGTAYCLLQGEVARPPAGGTEALEQTRLSPVRVIYPDALDECHGQCRRYHALVPLHPAPTGYDRNHEYARRGRRRPLA